MYNVQNEGKIVLNSDLINHIWIIMFSTGDHSLEKTMKSQRTCGERTIRMMNSFHINELGIFNMEKKARAEVGEKRTGMGKQEHGSYLQKFKDCHMEDMVSSPKPNNPSLGV